MTIELSHFSAAFIFALCASIVFGITQRENPKQMMNYGVYCFALFIVGVIVAGWAMWALKH
ncbi:MAG TPA: hypothetical protein VFM10_12225 [Terriglobales bacterium]|jgi:hypothetical protein|nr:hypothetical protein [Terriglobales bacterium]